MFVDPMIDTRPTPEEVNVRRSWREWTGGSQDVAAFCIDQYNRVLARLISNFVDPTQTHCTPTDCALPMP